MKRILGMIGFFAVLAMTAGAGYFAGLYGPRLPGVASTKPTLSEHGSGDGHDHAHEADPNQLPISDQGRRNLGLKTGEVGLTDFLRTITIPGVVEEKPGHSERRITTSVNGIVSSVHVLPGQTVRPGDPLLDIQTTGEVLANAQGTLLKTIQDLELVDLELKRIEPLAEKGSIPGTRVLEKKYERQRLESQRLVQMQELLVRGLTPAQVADIIKSKSLLRIFTVFVPGPQLDKENAAERENLLGIKQVGLRSPQKPRLIAESELVYSVESIDVFPGKLVEPGQELCDLAIHTNLQVVGLGFQRDAELINRALDDEQPVTAIFESTASEPLIREKLLIQYADNVVDPETRLFKFYIPLKNEIVRDRTTAEGVTFRAWRFKPGQRAQLRVPIERWTERIVLPTSAVVKEGTDAYVFRVNGKLFERVPVVVQYEDGRHCVLAQDGELFEGDEVALNEAYQLNLALKKAQGSGVDLHAGHNH